MRFLILSDRIPPENKGGAEVIAWAWAKALHRAGHEVHLVAATPKASFEAIREGIPTYHLHSRYAERWRAYWSLANPQTLAPLRQLYKRLRPDIVHAHNIHSDLSYYSLMMAQHLGIQTVFTSHDPMPFAYGKLTHFARPDQCDYTLSDYALPPYYNLKQARFRYNPLRNWLIRRMLERVRWRFAVSHALAQAHHANGLPYFHVIHNGVDFSQWRTTEHDIAETRHALGLEERKVILFAGRLTDLKGTQSLLDALRLIRQSVPNVALLVLSATPLAQQLSPERYAEFEPLIVHGGWRQGQALVNAYAVADVVAVPSLNLDPLPTVILEAGAMKKPVVATCFGGSKEIIQDGLTGYIVNPFQTEQLAHALITVLQDESHAQHIGQAHYRRVCDEFSESMWLERTFRYFL